jgi:hypothetical protein
MSDAKRLVAPWLLVLVLSVVTVPLVRGGETPTDPDDRVAYHLHEVEELAGHFESVLAAECPRFPTPDQWRGYVDGEIDRVVLLVAHLEQAWIEAKQTHDKELRRVAKAPRRRVEEARALVDKFQRCAADNGSSLAPLVVWQRIEREVPHRQAEIALPR